MNLKKNTHSRSFTKAAGDIRSLASVYGLLIPFIRLLTRKLLVQEEITGSVFLVF